MARQRKIAVRLSRSAPPGGSRSGRGADTCSTLRDKRDKFEQCRDARTNLRDRCYSSQRDGHDTAINEADVGRRNCAELMTSKGC